MAMASYNSYNNNILKYLYSYYFTFKYNELIQISIEKLKTKSKQNIFKTRSFYYKLLGDLGFILANCFDHKPFVYHLCLKQ